MAERDANERTEQPTPKRLEEARKKGQVPRSRDLGSAAVVVAGGLGLYGLGTQVVGGLAALVRTGLSFAGQVAVDPAQLTLRFEHEAALGLTAVASVLGLTLAAAVLAPLLLGGWSFSTEALAPDWSRLNPVSGLARVFSLRGLIELGKALSRFALVALVAAVLLWRQLPALLRLGAEPAHVGIMQALALSGAALIALGAALAVVALVDVPLELWQHQKSLRMSREELRDEHKETEGNPDVRMRVRRVQQQRARQRMMQHVPRADVVITNPTHFAVALRYEDGRMRAPVVVAKGRDRIAQRIREIAAEHRVAVVEAPPLARALHNCCEIGDEIPARLYAAVARVLTYVYQLRTTRQHGSPPPEMPPLEVPEE